MAQNKYNMSLVLKSIATTAGAIGMVITTEHIIVELNYKSIPFFLVCAVIFSAGLISLSKELKKQSKKGYKSLKKWHNDRCRHL